LNPIHDNPLASKPTSLGPFSGGLPAKIDAGEIKAFYFPYTKDCFLKERLRGVGILRHLWADHALPTQGHEARTVALSG
jgi:hypothetical protein